MQVAALRAARCGAGQIATLGTRHAHIMVVIAVVVTICNAGAAAGAMGATLSTARGTVAASSVGASSAGVGVLSGSAGLGAAALGAVAIGGAAGSIASQGAGIAMGNQQSFSCKAMGQATMGGAMAALH